jgi:acid phosphatase
MSKRFGKYSLLTSFLLLSFVPVSFAQQVPQVNHVFIVVEENAGFSKVIGNQAMPYLNSLANRFGLATNYFANTHPSIGNYFFLTTGQDLTNDDGQTPSNFPVSVDNVVRELLAGGKTWKDYAESLPSVGYTGGNTGQYAVRHNPLPYFTDVQNSTQQRQNLVPFEDPNVGFAHDLANNALPNYSFIVPNLCNDAHDCPLATADTWLRNNIDPLVTSALFQNDGILVIVFDEGDDNANGGGQVAWVVVSPKAKTGFRSTSTNLYQHQSTLRMMTAALGLTSFPGAAATAPDMAEFFGNSAPPTGTGSDFSLSASPASVSVTQGVSASYTLSINPSGGFTGTVSFAASGLPNGAIANFNPGVTTTSSMLTVTTTAATPPGSFTVTITGTSTSTSGTLTHTASVTLVVNAAPTPAPSPALPVAGLTVTPQTGTAPLQVTANSSGSSDTNGGIVSRTIDFGDGTTSTAVTATHTYNKAGTFTVKLSVTDNLGLTATASQTVMVNPAVPAPPPAPPISVTITSPSPTVPSGGMQQFMATVANATNQAVMWTATAGTISASGLFTGPVVSVNTTVTVTAATVATPSKSASVDVTVQPPSPPPPTNPPPVGPVPPIVQNPAPVTPTQGDDFSLAATPPSQPGTPNMTVKYMVTVANSGGSTGTIKLHVRGLPRGAKASFDPPSVENAGSSTLTVSLGESVRTKKYQLTIVGQSQHLRRSASVVLTTIEQQSDSETTGQELDDD